ncbi:MAG: hypothetical protein U0324_24490 [Polyangiales bacterium]
MKPARLGLAPGALGLLLAACAPPTARAPRPSSPACSLDALLRDAARPPPGGPAARRCPEADGVCGADCADAVRACALSASRANEPVVARWTLPLVDGVGRRMALVGAGAPYGLTWFEETFVASRGDGGRHRITAHRCAALFDLAAVCADARPPSACGEASAPRDDHLRLACAGGTARVVCDEAL